MVRNMVDAGGLNDLKAASAFEREFLFPGDFDQARKEYTPLSPVAVYVLPKLYSKNYYCVSCAVHSRIVRVRNVEKRKIRDPPVRFRRTEDKPAGGAAGGAPKPKV